MDFSAPLPGPIRVLVLEDDFILAAGLTAELRRLSADVMGPYSDLHEAIQHVDQAHAAILDIRLRDETAFPLADCLRNRETPFLFYSGCDESVIPSRFRDVPLFTKPARAELLVRNLRQRRRGADPEPDVVAALPILRLQARQMIMDDTAADRLVEATLAAAINALPHNQSGQQALELWLLRLMKREFVRRGPTLLH